MGLGGITLPVKGSRVEPFRAKGSVVCCHFVYLFKCIPSGFDAENSGLTQWAVCFPVWHNKKPSWETLIPAPYEYLKRLSGKLKERVKETLRRPPAGSRK